MTNTARKILIISASAIGTGVISAVSYIQGKKDGLALAAKRAAELSAAPTAHSGNRHVQTQPQA